MSIKWMNRVWDLPELQGTRRLLLLAIADNANDAGVCWPSIPTLARKCNVSERTIHKMLPDLVGRYLEMEARPGRSTIYRLMFDDMSTPEHGGRGEHGGTPTPEHGGRGPLNMGAPEPSRTTNRTTKERQARKRGSRKRDPLLDDDRVQAYREVCHLTANHQQRAQIVSRVKDPARWRGVLVEWMAHGWNPRNVSGMLERYTEPPTPNGHARNQTAAERSNLLTVEQVARRANRALALLDDDDGETEP